MGCETGAGTGDCWGLGVGFVEVVLGLFSRAAIAGGVFIEDTPGCDSGLLGAAGVEADEAGAGIGVSSGGLGGIGGIGAGIEDGIG